MKSRLIYNSVLLALAAVGVWGCSPSDDGAAPDKGLVDIRVSIDGGKTTRVAMNKDGSGSFATGDVIQFTTVESGVGRSESAKTGYTLGTTSMRWSQIAPYEESVTFRAHYPSWNNEMQAEGYDFSTATTNIVYPDDDRLFATATVSYQGGVLLNFKHMMSKLIVNLTKTVEGGSVAETKATVTFEDVHITGTQNWSDGAISGFGSKGGIFINYKSSDGYYSQLMIPQNLKGATFCVDYDAVTGEGGTKNFRSTITDDLMLEAGKVMTINSRLSGDKLVVESVTVNPWGEALTLDDGTGNGGEITEDDEIDWNSQYINIGNITDLNELAEKVNGGNDFAGKTITITKDIEVGNWTPIGYATMSSNDGYNITSTMTITGGRPFNGTFDGNGKKVKLVDINGSTAGMGLFGYVGSNGVVKNLYVEGSTTVSNAGHSGGIVGVNNGLVEGCQFLGTVKTNYNDCLGAVVGHNFGQVLLCASLPGSKVHYTGSQGIAMGGIVGVNEPTGAIIGCFSAAQLLKGSGDGSASGSSRGGIVGRNVENDYTDKSGTITSCYYSPSDCGTTSVCGEADNDTKNPSGSGSYASLSDLNSKIASMNTAAWASPYGSRYHWMAGDGTNYPTISK